MRLKEELEDSVLQVNNMNILPIIIAQQTMMQQQLTNSLLTSSSIKHHTKQGDKAEEKQEKEYVPKYAKKEDLKKERVSM